MKAIDMTDQAAKGFAQLMVRGLGEIGSRSAEELTSLETLALVATRLLVGIGAISLEKMTDLGITFVSELDQSTPRQLLPLRENLSIAYNNEEELRATGITFHTFQ